jgi:hypothetical protein
VLGRESTRERRRQSTSMLTFGCAAASAVSSGESCGWRAVAITRHPRPALLSDEFEAEAAIRTGDEYGRHSFRMTDRQRQNVRDNVAYT